MLGEHDHGVGLSIRGSETRRLWGHLRCIRLEKRWVVAPVVERKLVDADVVKCYTRVHRETGKG